MSVLIGAHPGGKNRYAVCGLFYGGTLPALLFRSRAYSGTQDVLSEIVGAAGEWGGLAAVAIDAPLTWSGGTSGWRDADEALRTLWPEWLPTRWLKPPNALTGAVAVQGPALAWSLAREIRNEILPPHRVVETHPRLGLARIGEKCRDAVLTYRDNTARPEARKKAISTLLDRFIDAGVVQLEDRPPKNHAELDALVAAVVALGTAFPESGVVVSSHPGSELRPVGDRPVNILDRLP